MVNRPAPSSECRCFPSVDHHPAKMVSSLAEQLRERSGSYMPRVVALFYTVFDPQIGPTIISQIPEGTVATRLSTFPLVDQPAPNPSAKDAGSSDNANTQVLFDLSSVRDIVIPHRDLCGHLITKSTRNSKILGFPIWLALHYGFP